jgi:hypothetical protein
MTSRVASAAAFLSSLPPGYTFIGLRGNFNAVCFDTGLAFLSILTRTQDRSGPQPSASPSPIKPGEAT